MTQIQPSIAWVHGILHGNCHHRRIPISSRLLYTVRDISRRQNMCPHQKFLSRVNQLQQKTSCKRNCSQWKSSVSSDRPEKCTMQDVHRKMQASTLSRCVAITIPKWEVNIYIKICNCCTQLVTVYANSISSQQGYCMQHQHCLSYTLPRNGSGKVKCLESHNVVPINLNVCQQL